MTRQLPGFVGFPDQKMLAVIVPDLFFVDLLPQIDDLAELKLTVYFFWLLNEQEGQMRFVRGDDMRSDRTLLQSLSLESDLRSPLAALEDALERAVARNTLIRMDVETEPFDDEPSLNGRKQQGDSDSPPADAESRVEDWYFLNTAKAASLWQPFGRESWLICKGLYRRRPGSTLSDPTFSCYTNRISA